MNETGNFSNSGEGAHERLAQISTRLEENREHYFTRDIANKTLGTFAEATLRALKLSYFRDQLEYVLSIREDLDASHTIKLLERCYQADLLEHDSEKYPREYRDDVAAWLQAFAEIEHDEERSGKLLFNMLTRRVQSNIAERYKTIKLLANIYSDRFDTPPSVLDVGSSELHGILKLAFDHNSRDELSFGEIALRTASSKNPSRYDKRITGLANLALHTPTAFSNMLGTDITDIDDPGTKRWVESCSYYPDEFMDRSKVREYALLEEIDPEHKRVGFIRADFSNREDFLMIRDQAPDGFDIVTLSTVLYQVQDKAERSAMLAHASEIVSERGIILIQDALDGNFTKPYNYRSIIKDAAHPELGNQEILRWKTARCNEAILGMGRVSVRGRLMSYDEALINSSR